MTALSRLTVVLFAVVALASNHTPAGAQNVVSRQTAAASALPVEIVHSASVPVWKPAFTPDGRYMAVGDGNGATLWDIEKKCLVRTFTGLKSNSTAVAVSPDGKTIAAGAGDTLNIWNIESGVVENTMALGLGIVSSIAFSKDGSRLIYSGSPQPSGGRMPSMFIRDVATGRTIKSHVGHGSADSLDISTEGRLLALGDGSGKIYLFDIDGRVQKILPGHTTSDGYYPVSALAFSPEGKILASVGRDRAAKLWDVASGRLIRALPGHTGTLHTASVSWSPDGTTLATSDDETLRIWDARTGLLRKAKTFQVGDGKSSASHARYMPDGRSLIVNAWGLKQVDPETLNPLGRFGTAIFGPTVPRSGAGRNAVMMNSSYPRQLLGLDVVAGTVREIFKDPDATSSWTGPALSRDGKSVVATNYESGALIILDVVAGSMRTVQQGFKFHQADISPDGQIVAVTGEKLITLVDTKSGNVIRRLAGNQYSPDKVGFTADGKALVTSWMGDTQIRIFSLPSGNSTLPVKFQYLAGENFAISPDSASFLAFGTRFEHYTAEHWSIAGPRLIRRLTLPGHKSMPNTGDIRPDGRLAVLGSDDGMLRIWDLASGSVVRTLRGHTGPIDKVQYVAGGERIVSGASDGLKIWMRRAASCWCPI